MKSSQKNYLHRDLSDLRRTGKDHGYNHVLSPSLTILWMVFLLPIQKIIKGKRNHL